jgi:hypothetical protein
LQTIKSSFQEDILNFKLRLCKSWHISFLLPKGVMKKGYFKLYFMFMPAFTPSFMEELWKTLEEDDFALRYKFKK